MRVRFGKWSGRQDPFPADVSADDVMHEIADDVLEGLSADQALERLLRRGLQGQARGLDELRRQVARARRGELERLGAEDPLREVEGRLWEILERERETLRFCADEDAAAGKRERLDGLSEEIAARLAELEGYDWEDQGAARDFRALMEELRRDVAAAAFGRLADALGAMTPDDVARMRDMLADLNATIAKQDRGEDVAGDFAAFRERYGDLLAGLPDDLDGLLDELARRMAAMSRLLAGMDADQRDQLAALADGLFDDLGLSFEASELERALRERHPELRWDESVGGTQPSRFQSGSLAETVDWIEHLQSYEELERALRQDYPGARLDDIDEEELRRLLGEDAVRDLRGLRGIERALEGAGAAQRRAGRLELTSRGARRLGEQSLARIYERAVGGALGSHASRDAGGDGDLLGSTRPLRYGDPFRVDVARSVFNAAARGGGGPPVRLGPDDLELAEAEQRIRATTVLLLDMSFSMPLRGNWTVAKRVAMALQSLVSAKFPEDRFYVVGFSDYARRLEPRDLLTTGWERVYGTNMQHAFLLARRLLGAHPGTERQVIMVTDGEPTAHLEEGVAYFSWPPERRTLQLTLAEAGRLARTGATLNVFLLDHEPGAAAFVERMVAGYGGRVFYPDLDNLGSTVVRDFLHRRAA